MIALLALGAAVAGQLFRLKARRAGAFLLVLVLSDGARLILAPLRAGAAKPYAGAAFALWLATEIAPALLSVAAALALTGRPFRAALAFLALFGLVALSYPAVRGDALLALLGAVYVASYAVASGDIVASEGRGTPDSLALLALLATGIASVLVVAIFGAAAWWAVTITFGCGVVGSVSAALGFFEPRG